MALKASIYDSIRNAKTADLSELDGSLSSILRKNDFFFLKHLFFFIHISHVNLNLTIEREDSLNLIIVLSLQSSYLT